MKTSMPNEQFGSNERTAKEWMEVLISYRQPNQWRSILELTITLTPFVVLWFVAWWSLSVSYLLTLAITVPAAGLLVRIFLIQHDCGHGSFFRRKVTNDWVGRTLGVLTFTPYAVWKRSHAIHHATSGNLDKRGTGDIDTLTVREYQSRSAWQKFTYRLYRHPLIMFGIGPAYVYLLRNRLPLGFMKEGWQYWLSAMGTNAVMAISAALLIYAVGWVPFLLIQLPIIVLAATFGVWMFYVQHQFEDTHWEDTSDWSFHDAALYGSSHYDLPKILRWFTANIGIHHVHHLNGKIPYYRLPQILSDFPELAPIKRLTLLESFSCVKLKLWDEDNKKLVSFKSAQAKQAA